MEQIKNEMIETIRQLKNENIEEIKLRIENYFVFIQTSTSLWGCVPSITVDKPIKPIIDNSIVEEIIDVEHETYNEVLENIEPACYPLERKLKGGIVFIGNKTEFIPESVIRAKDFKHGDFIKIEQINKYTNDFIKVKESDNTNCDREEVDFCRVVMKDGALVASEQIVGGKRQLIKLDGETPFTFLLRDDDIQQNNLTEDSIVAIAYSKLNPNYHKVSWIYHNFEETLNNPNPVPKPSSFYKEKSTEKNHWSAEEIKVLRGKEVVIVGADFRISDLIPLANAGQFKLHSLSGDESKTRIKAGIRKMDLIISASEHSSHRASETAKEYAKKYKIPFRASPTSLSMIKKALIHGFENHNISFHSMF